MKKLLMLVCLIVLVGVMGCKSKGDVSATEDQGQQMEETGDTGKGNAFMDAKKLEEPKEVTIDKDKKYYAVIHTNKGDITAELYAKDAPLSVTNYKYLADKGFYNGQIFHRFAEGFVIQGGDPTGTGSGGPGYTLPPEIKRRHKTGALAWARQGNQINPEKRSNGSQFYITLRKTPHLDGEYTVFGQVTEGMRVAGNLRVDDVIESIEVIEE